jgi:4-alpha-glucanotransferase
MQHRGAVRDREDVSERELRRLAAANGVATSYQDWRGRQVPVPRETVAAVLRALGVPATSTPMVERPVVPERRAWGFMIQLYALRSSRSWGLGDLRDLADLADWSGRALGAGFVLVNPLHAGEPASPIEPSPYLPVSRRFAAPLYLRVEDVPCYPAAPVELREGIAELAAPLRAMNHTLAPLDRDAVWAAKRAALELLHGLPRTAEDQASYDAYRNREGAALRTFATWCALAEEHGRDWRHWPVALRDPDSPAVAAERDRLDALVDFHAWLQWLLDRQLAAAQSAARSAGMPIGVIHDLALGIHPGGADAWAYQRLLAMDMRVGAPPDEFNQRGQEWAQPPWHPGRLAAADEGAAQGEGRTGYAPLRDLLRNVLRHAGGLRIDHVMQLFRLWWVPVGRSPDRGTYVRYDHAALLDVIGAEARRAGAVVVGEDLGTVEAWMREALAERDLLGTSMVWFERTADGAPRPPREWRELCLATIGTHDMPPIAGYLAGDHVTLRDRLGLLARPADAEAADHRRRLAEWAEMLGSLGLLPQGSDLGGAPDRAIAPAELLAATVALHGFLARTPARLIGVSLADAVGERRTQNLPGTTDEYPNWRVPLAAADGRPVLLDELPDDDWLRAAVAPVADALRASAGGARGAGPHG